MMTTPTPELPGLTLSDFEAYASLVEKTGYRYVKEGKVRVYLDGKGLMRVSPYEAYYFVRSRDEKKQAKKKK
jgi:hypothetical protein